jgi:protein-S-isoprenylcysteine O-methyltransferase Ste14
VSAVTRRSLGARALLSLVVLGAVMAALVFAAAGTLRYRQAWVYLAIFTGASALTTLHLLQHDRPLLERRMRGGPTAETRSAQRIIMLCTSVLFVALLVVPGLDRRFGGAMAPLAVVVAGDALVLLGFAGIFRVYRENSFTSATIEVSGDQKVVSTGPYAVVRHPMYASAALYLLGTPLALGSYWGLVPFVAMLPFLVWRLVDEERLLAASLPGYADYRRRVRYRLVPFVW